MHSAAAVCNLYCRERRMRQAERDDDVRRWLWLWYGMGQTGVVEMPQQGVDSTIVLMTLAWLGINEAASSSAHHQQQLAAAFCTTPILAPIKTTVNASDRGKMRRLTADRQAST